MDSMVSKTFMKVVSFGASLFLSIMAGLFAMISLSCLVMSVIDKDILTVAASAASCFIAYVCWQVRRDV